MNRKFAGTVGALSLGFAALLGTASTAQAQESKPAADVEVMFEGCLRGEFCLYQHDSFGGAKMGTKYSQEDLGLINFDNMASSMINGLTSGVDVYQYTGYSGVRYYASPTSSDKDFTNNSFDNKASSMRIR